MELEKVEVIINKQLVTIKKKSLHFKELFVMHMSLLLFEFLLSCNGKQVFSECKLVR